MSWMPSKYIRARKPFTKFEDFMKHLAKGGWVYHGMKVFHPAVISNWSLSMLVARVHHGALYPALPNPYHPANKKQPKSRRMPIPNDSDFQVIEK